MRIYKTPIITTGEQKVIGGKLSLRQFAYIMGGGLIAFALTRSLYALIGLPAIMLFPTIMIFCLLLAFFKIRKHDINLDSYIMLRIRYAMIQKEYTYGRR